MDRIHVHNLLINPTMDICQRGTHFSFGNQEETKYTLDRWGVVGSNITVSQSNDVPEKDTQSYRSLQITKNGSNPKSKIILFQKIEGYQLRYALSKILFFSGYFQTTVAGTYSIFLKNGDIEDSCNSIVMKIDLPANIWIPMNVLFASLPLDKGNWNFDEGIGLTLGITLGSPENESINYNGRWIENSNHKVLSNQVDFGSHDQAIFRVTQLQFHEGVSRVPFYELYRDIVLETLYCQRYFECIDIYSQTNLNYQAIPYKVDKRVEPQITSDLNDGDWDTLGNSSCYQISSSAQAIKQKFFIDAEL